MFWWKQAERQLYDFLIDLEMHSKLHAKVISTFFSQYTIASLSPLQMIYKTMKDYLSN